MAIRIRQRKSQKELIRRRTVQIRLASALGALALVLVSAVALYLKTVYFLVNGPPQFIAYSVREEEELVPVRPKTVDARSAAAKAGAASAAAMMPEIIVAATDAADFSSVAFSSADLGVATMPMVGVGMDMMPASLGGGLGFGGSGRGAGGTGNGAGGKGNGRSGGKKFGPGNNDDIQVVFALDASGSMNTLFEEVAASLEYLVNALNSCKLNGKEVKINLGIVAYGQGKDDGKPWVVSSFSRDSKSMRNHLKEVSCDGSIECCGEAIVFALEKFPWNRRERDNILKVIFIAGNEPFNQGEVDYRTALEQAQASGVIVNTIHCGGEAEDWKEAARLGGGEYFSIEIGRDGGEDPTDDDVCAAIRELWNAEVIPFGSFADRERAAAELKKRGNPPNKKGLQQWITKNRSRIFGGYAWDAVEVCRAVGKEFSLDMVGGLGNLPESLRAGGPDAAEEYLHAAARKRQTCLDNVRESLKKGGFCEAAMQALRIQASDKGINMEF